TGSPSLPWSKLEQTARLSVRGVPAHSQPVSTTPSRSKNCSTQPLILQPSTPGDGGSQIHPFMGATLGALTPSGGHIWSAGALSISPAQFSASPLQISVWSPSPTESLSSSQSGPGFRSLY